MNGARAAYRVRYGAFDFFCSAFARGANYRETFRTLDQWAQYGSFCWVFADDFCFWGDYLDGTVNGNDQSHGLRFASDGAALYPTLDDENP